MAGEDASGHSVPAAECGLMQRQSPINECALQLLVSPVLFQPCVGNPIHALCQAVRLHQNLFAFVHKVTLHYSLAVMLTEILQIDLTDLAMCVQRILGITKKQAQDLMYLRKLYLTQRGLLAADRGAMTIEMRNSDPQHSLPAAHLDRFEGLSNLDRLSDLSSRLKANAAADYAAYLKIACAVRRGVSCSMLGGCYGC